jgi:hypothetical protein
VVQKREPAGRAAPQAAQDTAVPGAEAGPGAGVVDEPAAGEPGWGAGGAAGGTVDELADAAGGTAGVAWGMGGTPAARGAPHAGQATHAGSSIGVRQAVHRPTTNGSMRPQNGQRAASRAMYFPQPRQGCLNDGMGNLSAVGSWSRWRGS